MFWFLKLILFASIFFIRCKGLILKKKMGKKIDRIHIKSKLKKTAKWIFKKYGLEFTIEFNERIKNFGFRSASMSFSLGVEDLLIIKEKIKFTKFIEEKKNSAREKEKIGILNKIEKNDILIFIFRIRRKNLKNEIFAIFRKENLYNSLYLMVDFGARGNFNLVNQLSGFRGLTVNFKNCLVSFPINRSLKTGITIVEAFISCHGSRKGIVDRAIQTANSGYMTRRLVNIRYFQVVSMRNCGACGTFLFPLTNFYRKKIISPRV